jgi:hypothetical protein
MKEALSSSETWFLQEPHGITSQKTPFFIVTAVKTSTLTKQNTGSLETATATVEEIEMAHTVTCYDLQTETAVSLLIVRHLLNSGSSEFVKYCISAVVNFESQNAVYLSTLLFLLIWSHLLFAVVDRS